ncbi:alpha/beta-hydrolase [Atractiella rhizophila]|nr:alpha/beta-hydrolase [Atractiella rhizophila]
MKLFALTALAFQVALAAPTVEVKQGTIVGVDLPNFDQEIFLGIPYAQPPLGDLRLRKPQAYNSTYDNFDASKYSPLCWNLQSTISDGNDSPQDEDCRVRTLDGYRFEYYSPTANSGRENNGPLTDQAGKLGTSSTLIDAGKKIVPNFIASSSRQLVRFLWDR